MNELRAQMAFDLASLKGLFGRQIVLAIVVGIFVGIVGGSMAAAVAACAFVMPITLIFTMLSYDETQGWQAFRLAMPISRKSVVMGRYAGLAWICLIGIVCGLAAFALIFIIASVASSLQTGIIPSPADLIGELASMRGGEITEVASALLALCAFSLSLILIMLAFMLPFVLSMGFTKAARIIPVAMMVFAVVVMLLVGGMGSASTESALEAILSPVGIAVVLVSCIVLYAASCLIAIRLYGRREF